MTQIQDPTNGQYDNDIVQVTLRNRDRNGFGDLIYIDTTVADARHLRGQLAGLDFSNTKKGDVVFLGVAGTTSQQIASGMWS